MGLFCFAEGAKEGVVGAKGLDSVYRGCLIIVRQK
jgi:hypothetical protein